VDDTSTQTDLGKEDDFAEEVENLRIRGRFEPVLYIIKVTNMTIHHKINKDKKNKKYIKRSTSSSLSVLKSLFVIESVVDSPDALHFIL